MAVTVVCSVRILTVAIAVVSVTATLSCPPGFVSQGNSCACADWPDEIITCDEDSLNASIVIGYCMTYDNETEEVRVGYCQQALYRSDSYKFYYHFLLKYQLSMITCVVHLIEKVYSVESARMALQFHLSTS